MVFSYLVWGVGRKSLHFVGKMAEKIFKTANIKKSLMCFAYADGCFFLHPNVIFGHPLKFKD